MTGIVRNSKIVHNLWSQSRVVEMTERRQTELEIFRLSHLQLLAIEEATFLGWSEKEKADYWERERQIEVLGGHLKKSA